MFGSAPWSERTAPADDSEQDYHDGDNQENMDEAAHGVGSHQAQEPQDDQNDGDGIKHVDILSWLNSNSPDQESARTDPWTVLAQRLGFTPISGAAVHKADFPLRVPQTLCAGVHTPQVFYRTLRTCKVFAPCRGAAISPATRGGTATEGN